ncbi:MAG: ATP12 family protein [Pseudomonadota bacterium]
MRRFYKAVEVVPCAGSGGGGFTIQLDGKPVRTPARAPFIVQQQPLADAIAAEWSAQGQDITPATMPLTGLANAAIDLATPNPIAFAAPLAAFGESDLLCYRAPEADLAAEQARLWNPILSWAENHYGIEFALATGIIHVAQPPATLAALTAAVHALDANRLAALAPLVTIGGSLVVALALMTRAFDPDALWDAVTLDEIWQERKWGAVDDAVEAREAKQREWLSAARFLELLRQP